ncbi:LVIVD repeat-containing protein [Corallococcus sp. AB045]|uniref:LVIVD repeat-containing protein n=1 Tax=Corallococcus sp. AB045 TaxID=2316719 RepID=UPI0018F3C5C1|nr:hypothetical protein [Corallococcus sp. AB045]
MVLLPRWLLLALPLALSGCFSDGDGVSPLPLPPPDSGTSDAGVPDAGIADAGVPDAGSPDAGVLDAGVPDAGGDAWDGGAVTLSDPGDMVDPGPYSACVFHPKVGETVAACDDPALFDRSMCPAGAFADLDTASVYEVRVRSANGPNLTPYTVVLPSDGGVGRINGQPLVQQDVGPGAFFFSAEVPFGTGTRWRVFAGCERPQPGRIHGCYVQCSQGKVLTNGSFTAIRPAQAWGPGESAASGLSLVSESAVPLAYPADVYIAKEHAYVVATGGIFGAGGLAVFDVKDRAHPVLKKTVQLAGDTYWNGVWAKDDALYIASANSGVIVYDITDPANPQYVRALPGGAINVHTVHVQGNRLYAMAPAPTSQTLLFDVSSPLAPALLERITPSDAPGGVHDAFAYGDRLYVNHTFDGYIAFDVSDPARVRELGRYTYAESYSHANAVGTFGGRTIAFEGGELVGAHLRVLDVTDPANMRLIGGYALRPEFSIHNMVLVGTRLYVAWYHEGVRVLDVSVPPSPREVAYFHTYREREPGRLTYGLYSGAIGIRVPGDGFIYVVDTTRGLLILSEQP